MQTINKTGNTVSLSHGGGTFSDSDNQTLSLNGITLSISNGNSIQIGGTVDLDYDPTNEIQSLSFINDTLSLSQSNFVIIPSNFDTDSTNELQTLTTNGNDLTISKGNTVTITQQNLSISNDTLAISDGNYIVLPPEADNDTTNELQNLSLQSDSLTISKGNSIKLSFLEYLVPVGTIIPFAGRTPPTGWLLCNGDTLNRISYSTLFSVIDSSWGKGDGATTFHLPDLRGQFLRGVDGTANVDPDKGTRTAKYTGGNIANNVGSYQGDDLKSHRHELEQIFITFSPGGSSIYNPAGGGPGTTNFTKYSGGNETRPQNAYVNFIIKY